MQAPGSGFAIGAVIGRNTDKVWRIGQGRAGRRAGVGHSDVEPDVVPPTSKPSGSSSHSPRFPADSTSPRSSVTVRWRAGYKVSSLAILGGPPARRPVVGKKPGSNTSGGNKMRRIRAPAAAAFLSIPFALTPILALPADAQLIIGYVTKSASNQGWTLINKGAEDAAIDAGVRLIVARPSRKAHSPAR